MKTLQHSLFNCLCTVGFTYLLLSSCQRQYTDSQSAAVKAGQPLDSSTAQNWTQKHRHKGLIAAGALRAGRSHYFRKSFIDSMINQPNCVGLRIYQAFDDDKEARLILVGVGLDNADLIGSYPNKLQGNYLIGTTKMKCPNNCDYPTSPLMQDQ